MEIENINLNNLIGGLEQVGHLNIPDIKLNYAIGKNLRKLDILGKSYNKSLLALVNEHIQMDEKGNPVLIGERYLFKTAKDKEAYIKKKTKIDEMKNEIDLWKLKTSELKNAKSAEVTNRDGTKTEVFLNGNLMFLLFDIIDDDANILDKPDESENNIPKKSEVASS